MADGDDGKQRGTGFNGTIVIAATSVGEFFALTGFEVSLVIFGIVIAGASIGASLEDSAWGLPEFFGSLGFAALLVLAGCADRWVVRTRITMHPPSRPLELSKEQPDGQAELSQAAK